MQKTIGVLGYVGTLVAFLVAVYFFNNAVLGLEPHQSLYRAWQPLSYRAPIFLIPFAIAWLMPDWRWLGGFIAVMALGALSSLIVPVDAGPGFQRESLVSSTKDLVLDSGAGAGFVAGVVGRTLGLALIKFGLAPVLAWSLQIIPALFVFAAAIGPHLWDLRTPSAACHGRALAVGMGGHVYMTPIAAPFSVTYPSEAGYLAATNFGDRIELNKFCERRRSLNEPWEVAAVSIDLSSLEAAAGAGVPADPHPAHRIERFCTATAGQTWRDPVCAPASEWNDLMPETVELSAAGSGACLFGATCAYHQFWFELTGEALTIETRANIRDVERTVAKAALGDFTRYEITRRAEDRVDSGLYYVAQTLKDPEDLPLTFLCIGRPEAEPLTCRTAYRFSPALFLSYSFQVEEADFSARAQAIDARVRAMVLQLRRPSA